MQITITGSDGTEHQLDARSLTIMVGETPVEIRAHRRNGRMLTVLTPGADDHWQQFVIHPGAANVFDLEVKAFPRNKQTVAKEAEES